MKKLLFLLLLPFCGFCGIAEDLQLGAPKVDDITYDWLTGYAVFDHNTDHVTVFKKLFQQTKVKTILEFGLGYSTKYFLDHCNKVISVDIITHGYGPQVMKKFLSLYHDYSNWIPIAFFSGYLDNDYTWAPYKHLGSEALYKATSYQNLHHRNYAKIDDFYITELNAFAANLVKYNKADVAFVGHSIVLRGDVVQILFNKVPIIIAHDTLGRVDGVTNDDLHGYSWVVTPENYEEIFFPVEGGTTAWIRKKPETADLIAALKKFSEELK